MQRHRARRLHYDFRLEIDGVLVSWAVPKGPTLDPDVRRLGVPRRGPPVEYFDFEGVIPAGEYGGGDVIVWDAGTWEPTHGDGRPRGAVADGELHVDLFGEKLRGRFVLVRTEDGRAARNRGCCCTNTTSTPSPGWDPEDHPRSVLSGRTNDEVKADPDRLWRSDLPAARAAQLLEPAAVGAAGDDEMEVLDRLKPSGGRWPVFGREFG